LDIESTIVAFEELFHSCKIIENIDNIYKLAYGFIKVANETMARSI